MESRSLIERKKFGKLDFPTLTESHRSMRWDVGSGSVPTEPGDVVSCDWATFTGDSIYTVRPTIVSAHGRGIPPIKLKLFQAFETLV